MQDLRSTFATHWLLREADSRMMIFDLLISELADLMGHNSTHTTQKYINFMNSVTAKLEFAKRKNREAQRALKTNKEGN
jgi:integrase